MDQQLVARGIDQGNAGMVPLEHEVVWRDRPGKLVEWCVRRSGDHASRRTRGRLERRAAHAAVGGPGARVGSAGTAARSYAPGCRRGGGLRRCRPCGGAVRGRLRLALTRASTAPPADAAAAASNPRRVSAGAVRQADYRSPILCLLDQRSARPSFLFASAVSLLAAANIDRVSGGAIAFRPARPLEGLTSLTVLDRPRFPIPYSLFPTLDDSLPERAQYEPDRQLRRAILRVEHGVHFDDIERR